MIKLVRSTALLVVATLPFAALLAMTSSYLMWGFAFGPPDFVSRLHDTNMIAYVEFFPQRDGSLKLLGNREVADRITSAVTEGYALRDPVFAYLYSHGIDVKALRHVDEKLVDDLVKQYKNGLKDELTYGVAIEFENKGARFLLLKLYATIRNAHCCAIDTPIHYTGYRFTLGPPLKSYDQKLCMT